MNNEEQRFSSWTELSEVDLDAELEQHRDDLNRETLVSFPMSAWLELEFLVDAFPNRVVLAYKSALAEGEEDGQEWVFFCTGMTPEQTLEQVLLAVSDAWTAASVPVRPGDLAGARIEIMCR